ncbi:UNVERIFIED_CONTAM: hypothetical protein GTU68_033645 [Idotea baltica]|nr:hypothetical protein [Idotea baltica]
MIQVQQNLKLHCSLTELLI